MQPITYSTVSYEDVPQVVNLLNNTVSFGLATEENTSRLVSSKWSLIAKCDDKVVGHISGHKIDSLTSEMLYHSDLVDTIADLTFSKPLVLLNHLTVNADYRMLGIASNLTETLLALLGVDYSYIVLGWVKPHGWEAEKIALKHGFEIIAIKELFWYEDSSQGHYSCPYCGSTCKCSAKIAIKR